MVEEGADHSSSHTINTWSEVSPDVSSLNLDPTYEDLRRLYALEESVTSWLDKKADHGDNDEDINKGKFTKKAILEPEHVHDLQRWSAY